MLAKSLKNQIDSKKWSIATLARESGIHREMISKILRGETEDPRMTTLIRLSKGLGCTLDELAGCDKSAKPKRGDLCQ